VPKRRIEAPYLGASDSPAFLATTAGVCPPTRLLNVVPITGAKNRRQIGLRPGAVKAFAQRMGGGARVQAIGAVSRARIVTGLRAVAETPLSGQGRSIGVGALVGQVWGLEPNYGMYLSRHENVSAGGEYADTGPSGPSVVCSDMPPTVQRIVYASNYTDASGFTVARVTCVDSRSGERYWSHKIVRPGAEAFVNMVSCTDERVFIATNQFVRVLDLASGAAVASELEFNCGGWSDEVVAVRPVPDGSAVLIAFRGSSAGPAILRSGVVVSAGRQAGMWRSGVMRAAVQPFGAATPLVRSTLGVQLPFDDRYYEGPTPYTPHGYLRLSECLPGSGPGTVLAQRRPRGRWPTGLEVLEDGSFVVAHTNTGWGPSADATHVPPSKPGHDYAPPGGPYTSLSLFDAAGVLIRSWDAPSLLELKADGFYSDIPDPGTDQTPSINAVAARGGFIAAGGRRNATVPANLFVFTREGVPVGAIDLSTTITENGLAFSRTDGALLVAGFRTTTWPGSGGDNAHLWVIDAQTGQIVKGFDLGADVSALSVCSAASGRIVYTTDKV
jgi:hypothetical protein